MYWMLRNRRRKQCVAGVSVVLILLLNILWFGIPAGVVSANEKPNPNMIKADEKNNVQPASESSNGAAPGALPQGSAKAGETEAKDPLGYKAAKTFNSSYSYLVEVAKAVEGVASNPSGGNVVVGLISVVSSGAKVFNDAGAEHWSSQALEKGLDPVLKAIDFRAAFQYQQTFTGAVNGAANLSWWAKLKNEFSWTTISNGPTSVLLAKLAAPFSAISAGFGVYDVVQGAKKGDGWKVAEGTADIIGGLAGAALPFLLATPAAPIVAGIALGAALVSVGIKYRKEIAAAAKWVWNQGKALAGRAWNAAKNLGSAISQGTKALASAAKKTASRVASAVANAAKRAVSAAKKTASRVAAAVKNTAKRAASAVKKTASRAASAVKKTAKRAYSAAKKTATRVASAVKNTAKRTVAAVKKTTTRAVRAVKTAKKVVGTTVKAARRAASAVKKITQKPVPTVRKAASRAWSGTRKAARAAKSSVSKFFGNVRKAFG
ncbi:hypothetical protein KDJ56_01880 [Brevibacillus composti]|uniref:Uncharacterized protein n=1 Tax=Brevibacillus composti TaxID=2796470 RepID=A0A7T5JP12_9BACL|nr:hypothetical protein [Brevibacillus composti]QQE74759.1 hypothetical protein JD108_01880 [Brevibacillus composti]QUO41844.1 hypothetical protein KDJ56_01880 [Brevibacillus composti]